MAATKSKLNSKMPKVSNITIGSKVTKRGTVAYTGENGKLGTCYVYFKQNRTTYPFQIEYRTRSRYNEVNEKVKGAKWTKWSDWKNARAFTSPVLGAVPFKGKNTKYPINQWMKANKGVNKKSKYVHAMTLTGHAIGSDYDGRQFQFRIRTFNRAKARHGSMCYGTVTVWKRTAITNEKMFVSKDNGLDLRFHYKGNSDGLLTVKSIKDSKGIELLKPDSAGINYPWTWDSHYTGSLATWYTPAKAVIKRSALTRDIEYGEKLTCDIVYTNEYGAPTKLALTNVQTMDLSLIEGIKCEFDSDHSTGVLIVKLIDNQIAVDAVEDTECTITYTDKTGKDCELKPIAESKVLDGSTTEISQFAFLPPYNVTFKIKCKLVSAYGPSAIISYNYTMHNNYYTFTREWWDLDIEPINKWVGKDGDYEEEHLITSAWSNVDYSISTETSNIYLNPLGSKIAWGTSGCTAPTTTLTFSASVINREDEVKSSCLSAWQTMRKNLDSTYVFRTPYGEVYTVLIDSLNIEKESSFVWNVYVSAKEIKEIV